MKVVLPGGSGHVGRLLAEAFQRRGDEVVLLSRGAAPIGWRTVRWDGVTVGDWASELENASVIINLAGRSVNCRYNARNRGEILESRVRSTRAVGEAIARCRKPPRLWLQASTATIYAHRFDAGNDEFAGLLGGSEPDSPNTWRFSIEVASAWEEALNAASTPGTRKIAMRSAIVMNPAADGPFAALLRHVRLGFGRMGDGRQFLSWIHDLDFTRAVLWLIDRDDFVGPVNIAAPNPLPNAEFLRQLREAWGGWLAIPTTGPVLSVGAFLARTETELVLKSRRVIPRRLLESGFDFRFPRWPEAARDLCARFRAKHRRHAQ